MVIGAVVFYIVTWWCFHDVGGIRYLVGFRGLGCVYKCKVAGLGLRV